MGAVFVLFGLFAAIGIVYPAIMAVIWAVCKINGANVRFRDFMREI